MLHFILNDQSIVTQLASGSTVLDFVRYNKRLVGTKIGCREGDCGACTVLVGDIENGKLVYRSMTSCLMPLGNAVGKHIVTIEGINLPAGRHRFIRLCHKAAKIRISQLSGVYRQEMKFFKSLQKIVC